MERQFFGGAVALLWVELFTHKSGSVSEPRGPQGGYRAFCAQVAEEWLSAVAWLRVSRMRAGEGDRQRV